MLAENMELIFGEKLSEKMQRQIFSLHGQNGFVYILVKCLHMCNDTSVHTNPSKIFQSIC